RLPCLYLPLFSSLLPLPPRSTLFPYTTLFRSERVVVAVARLDDPLVAVGADDRMRDDERPRLRLHVEAPIDAPQVLEVGRQVARSEEHTSELQSRSDLVCRLLLEKKKEKIKHL